MEQVFFINEDCNQSPIFFVIVYKHPAPTMTIGTKTLVLILLITIFRGTDSKSQTTDKTSGSKNGFYLYSGLNWKYIYGSGVTIPNPNQVDPVYPNTDSVQSYNCLSPHIGIHYNAEVLKSLHLRIGIELNMRQYHFRIYRDSISRINYPDFSDYRRKINYYNIEIPAEIAYYIKRFGFGVGAKFIVYELELRKYYLNDEVYTKHYDHHILFRIHQPKILYPNIFVEYLVFQNPKIPLWMKASLEFGDYSSSLLLSLKTKL